MLPCGPRVTDAGVPVGVPPAQRELPVEVAGDPLRPRLAAQPAPGARVPERTAVEVPGCIVQAGPVGIGLRVAGVGAAKRLPARMVGRHLHDRGAGEGKRRVGRRRVPVRDHRVGPQSLDVVLDRVAQRAVDLEEGARLLLLVDQVVIRGVTETAGPALVDTAEVGAAGIEDVRGPRRRRAHREGSRVAEARPASPGPRGVLAEAVERPGPLRHLELLAADPLHGEDGAGGTDVEAPDAGDGGIAPAVEVVVRDVDLEAAEVAAGHEVGDAAHRVRAVGRRRALLQHLQPPHGDRGDRVHVHEAPPDQARRDRHVALAVDEHERPRGAQPAQVDVGHVLGEGRRLVRVVPTVPFADHAVADRQVPEEIDELGASLLLERLAADHGDGVGHVDGGRLDGGAGHGDGDLLEESPELQFRVHREGVPRHHLHLALELLEPGQAEGDEVVAGGQFRGRELPAAVGHGHLRGGQRRPGHFDGHPGQRSAAEVGHRSRNAAVLRGGEPRRHQETHSQERCFFHAVTSPRNGACMRIKTRAGFADRPAASCAAQKRGPGCALGWAASG